MSCSTLRFHKRCTRMCSEKCVRERNNNRFIYLALVSKAMAEPSFLRILRHNIPRSAFAWTLTHFHNTASHLRTTYFFDGNLQPCATNRSSLINQHFLKKHPLLSRYSWKRRLMHKASQSKASSEFPRNRKNVSLFSYHTVVFTKTECPYSIDSL